MRAHSAIPLTTTHGFPVGRAGSIVGISVAARVANHVANGTITIGVIVASGGAFGAAVFTAVSGTVTGAGEEVFYNSQLPGVDQIAPGDLLGTEQTVSANFQTQDVLVIVDVEWDT
jgi:hypothetical protein